jgi:hypothetical protein
LKVRHIEITTMIGCRVACVYCPQDKISRRYFGEERMMKFDDFKLWLRKQFTFVIYSNREPPHDGWKRAADLVTGVHSKIADKLNDQSNIAKTFKNVQSAIPDFAHDNLDSSTKALTTFASSTLMLLAAQGLTSTTGHTQTVTVTAKAISNAFAGPTMPCVGISAEWADLAGQYSFPASPQGIYTPQNTSWISLLQGLTPPGTCGILRVGGGSSDQTSPYLPLTPQIANDLAGTIAALRSNGSQWYLLYGLNGGLNNPAQAQADAGTIYNAMIQTFGGQGVGMVAFQVFNEPDVNGQSLQQFQSLFTSYSSAVVAAYSNYASQNFINPGTLNFGAPDTSSAPTGFSWFHQLQVPGGVNMQYESVHYYQFNYSGQSQKPSIDAVLQSANVLSTLGANAGASITETGMSSDGGWPGVTNVDVATAWEMRLYQTAALGGFVGIMNHNYFIPSVWGDGAGPRPAYYNFATINNGNYSPTPMYWGANLAGMVSGQPMIQVATTPTGLNVTALQPPVSITATQDSSGNPNIVVVNQSQKTINFVPTAEYSWGSGQFTLVEGHTSEACADPNPTVTQSPIQPGQGVAMPPCAVGVAHLNLD